MGEVVGVLGQSNLDGRELCGVKCFRIEFLKVTSGMCFCEETLGV